MEPLRPFSRRKLIGALVLGGVVLGGGFVVLRGLGVFPVSTRWERKADYEITYKTYDAFGHRGTTRTIHYLGSRRNVLVARGVSGYEINQYNTRQMLYEYCADGEGPTCGVYYFNADRGRSWKVSSRRALEERAWSPDGRFAVLSGQYDLRVVNLTSGTGLDLSDTLGLREGRRFVRFASWSPDLRKAAVLVGEYLDRAPPYRNVAEDIVVIDLYGGPVWYVATAGPRGWDRRRFSWKQTASGYVMWAPPDGPDDFGTIYRKTALQLPGGMAPQP